MKKVINYFSTQFICKMILMILAVVTGGGAMAVADLVEPQIGDEGPNPASDATVKATQLVRLYDIKAIGDTNKYLPVVCQERRSLVVRSRQQSVAVVVVSYIHLPLSVVVFEQYQRHTIFRSHPNIFIVVFYH